MSEQLALSKRIRRSKRKLDPYDLVGGHRHSYASPFYGEPYEWGDEHAHYLKGHYLFMDGSREMACNPEELFLMWGPIIEKEKVRRIEADRKYMDELPIKVEKLRSQFAALEMEYVREVDALKADKEVAKAELAALRSQGIDLTPVRAELEQTKKELNSARVEIENMKGALNQLITVHNNLVQALRPAETRRKAYENFFRDYFRNNPAK